MKNWDGYSNLVLGKVLFWRFSFGFVEISWIFFWTSGSQVNCLERSHDSSMLESNQAPSPGFWKTISTRSSLSMVALPWPAAIFEFLSLASHQWTHSAISSCSSFLSFSSLKLSGWFPKTVQAFLHLLVHYSFKVYRWIDQNDGYVLKKDLNLYNSFFKQLITLQ